jgi:hypothetical protein
LPAVPVATPSSSLTTTEAGGTATFALVLDSLPSADVVVQLSSTDSTEGVVDPIAATFTTSNWQAPQTIIVTGTDDSAVDGSVSLDIQATVGSFVNAVVSVTNTDGKAPHWSYLCFFAHACRRG